ncbi:hypothetical protein [Bradyrhizobium sp. 17]|uniref:hypothetical protein n=1 Tax=Bradyrhizobium sp. 17 TaxID=2782649 RepID=UPI001FF8B233|nr:hypothetical protein [Bradyrhizobium sp. 17]MCK1525009.1 hypothetical protein [Bradyrhizobium sp. 17]
MIFHARRFKFCVALGGVCQPARNPKPLVIGLPARIEAVDAFLGAKGCRHQ